MKDFARYQEAIRFLEGLINLPLEKNYMSDRSGQSVYLERMKYFLRLLGNPEKSFKYIHVTGTSGKGTVTTMLHDALHSSGKKVGSFTSPFVVTTIEKIRVGGLYISPDDFADIVEYLKPFLDELYTKGPYGMPSYFEICLAIAFVYFKRQKCEWVVLEVGAGGRYDATNIIEKPVVVAITNIDYDHTQLLGKTLQKIARDKMGIIKKGSVFYTTERRAALLRLFQAECEAKGVVMQALPSTGSYQEDNVLLATAVLHCVGVTERDMLKSFAQTRLACRFEVMQKAPLVVLDGAHNRAKIKSTIDNLKRLSYKKLHLVIAMAENKDSHSMLSQIIPLADTVCVTRFQVKDRKCAPPKELAVATKKYLKKGTKMKVFLDPLRAYSEAYSSANKQDLVLVVGSFFLAGELRKKWYPEQKILEKRKSF